MNIFCRVYSASCLPWKLLCYLRQYILKEFLLIWGESKEGVLSHTHTHTRTLQLVIPQGLPFHLGLRGWFRPVTNKPLKMSQRAERAASFVRTNWRRFGREPKTIFYMIVYSAGIWPDGGLLPRMATCDLRFIKLLLEFIVRPNPETPFASSSRLRKCVRIWLVMMVQLYANEVAPLLHYSSLSFLS